MSRLSKAILIVSGIFLVISIFVPLWQIDLDAPQYPEGLKLLIWADKIAGDVEIINGLNHYIGMKTLHTEDFIEFKILPYLIGAFALLFLLAAVMGTKRWLYTALITFALFGIIAMVDFWKWEYDYGHNLDPNAAIKVPGMAYQPPLIGFKQLLNFGAYSMPSTGGWLFLTAGLLLLFASLREMGWLRKLSRRRAVALALPGLAAALMSCGDGKPEAIRLHIDGCDFCRMTISDGKFGAELITRKNRIYKFDDLSCMLDYAAEHGESVVKSYYIADYLKDNELTEATSAWYVRHEEVKSPMGGNVASFTSREAALEYAEKWNVPVINWEELSQNRQQHRHHEHHH